MPLLPGCASETSQRALVAAVGVRLAVRAERVPEAARELDVQLRVRAHALLPDRDQLERLEARLRDVDGGAEDREREREHDLVGRDRLRRRLLGERERERPDAFRRTATSSDPVVICPGSAAASRSVIWSLPPATWYFSFEAPKRRRLPWPAVAEQVDQVERALLGRLGAVLDVVGDVEELPDPGVHPAREGLLDPVDDRHVVELAAARGRALERRRVARRRDVGMDLLPRRLEVVRHLVGAIRGAVEVAEHSVPFCSA